MSEPFSRIAQYQLPNLCGAASLSSALYLLGIDATQLQVARAAGRPVSALVEGLDEEEIKRAAEALRASVEFVAVTDKSQGALFAQQLRKHLEAGLPSVVLVWDYAHWVAVLAFHDGRFIVMDPFDPDRCFSRWSERHLIDQAWNEEEDEPSDEPPVYFGILLRRADGKPPRFKPTPAFVRLCEEGSAQTANQYAADLVEMVQRASPAGAVPGDGVPVAEVLEQREEDIVETVVNWTAADSRRASATEVRALVRDFVTIAHAMALRLPASADVPKLMLDLMAIVATYAWTGEL